MATRRGPNNEERLALDLVTVTADSSLVLQPCFVYSVWASLLDTNVTGHFALADSSASGSCGNESAKIHMKIGCGGVSAAGQSVVIDLPKPIFISKTLAVDITNVAIGVAYLPAK